MVEIVNLRQERKRKARGVRERAAEENRARFGRSKADVKRDTAQRALDDARHDGHRVDAHSRSEDDDG
jgi:hypothetical protein